MKDNDQLVEQVYLAVQPEGGNSEVINIWIVNEANEDFEYRVRSGEFASLDDGVLESSVAKRAQVRLPARSAAVFEEDDFYGLDFVVWWEIDLVDGGGNVHPLSATRGKYGWTNISNHVPIPFTDKRGALLRLRRRGQ